MSKLKKQAPMNKPSILIMAYAFNSDIKTSFFTAINIENFIIGEKGNG